MGLDLVLYPIWMADAADATCRTWTMATKLHMNRHRALFKMLGPGPEWLNPGEEDPRVVDPLPIPDHVTVYGEEYERRTDCYGKPLTFVTAEAITRNIGIPPDAGNWNRAALTFISLLPERTPVILEWS